MKDQTQALLNDSVWQDLLINDPAERAELTNEIVGQVHSRVLMDIAHGLTEAQADHFMTLTALPNAEDKVEAYVKSLGIDMHEQVKRVFDDLIVQYKTVLG